MKIQRDKGPRGQGALASRWRLAIASCLTAFALLQGCNWSKAAPAHDACDLFTQSDAQSVVGPGAVLYAHQSYSGPGRMPAVSSCMYAIPGTMPFYAASVSIREEGIRAADSKVLELHVKALKNQLGASYPIEKLEIDYPATWDPVRGQLTAFTDRALLTIAVSGPEDPGERKSRSIDLSRRIYKSLQAAPLLR